MFLNFHFLYEMFVFVFYNFINISFSKGSNSVLKIEQHNQLRKEVLMASGVHSVQGLPLCFVLSEAEHHGRQHMLEQVALPRAAMRQRE